MLFDRYITVDWSANSKPKEGPNTIWICDLSAQGEPSTANPRTRRAAEAILRESLRRSVESRERVLVGFDFPYAYPAGLASALSLSGEAWTAIWKYLEERIEDDEKNRNNRFEVADAINAQLRDHLFWGQPTKKHLDHLLPTADRAVYATDGQEGWLTEWREVERVLRRNGQYPQSTWKLNGNGSVGGQSLTGIPVLARLRTDPALAPCSKVWPFEVMEPNFASGQPAVLHAEIWPSLLSVPEVEGQVKDESQVIYLAREYRTRDLEGSLASLFAAASSPLALEEGWILGVN